MKPEKNNSDKGKPGIRKADYVKKEFDDDLEDLLIRKELKSRIEIDEQILDDFKDRYKTKIEGKLDAMIYKGFKEAVDKVLSPQP